MLLNYVLSWILVFLCSASVLSDKPHGLTELPRMDIHETRHRSEGTLSTLLFTEVTESSAGSFSASLPHIALAGISCLHIPLTLAVRPFLHNRPNRNPRSSTLPLSGKSLFRTGMCLTCCSIFSPWLMFLRRSLIHDALKRTVETQL